MFFFQKLKFYSKRKTHQRCSYILITKFIYEAKKNGNLQAVIRQSRTSKNNKVEKKITIRKLITKHKKEKCYLAATVQKTYASIQCQALNNNRKQTLSIETKPRVKYPNQIPLYRVFNSQYIADCGCLYFLLLLFLCTNTHHSSFARSAHLRPHSLSFVLTFHWRWAVLLLAVCCGVVTVVVVLSCQ